MQLKSLWLLLTGVILSTVILTTGNAAYNNKISQSSINHKNQVTKEVVEDEKIKPQTIPKDADNTEKSSLVSDNSVLSLRQEIHPQTNDESKTKTTDQSDNQTKDDNNKTNNTPKENNNSTSNQTSGSTENNNNQPANQTNSNNQNNNQTHNNNNQSNNDPQSTPITGPFTPPVVSASEQKEYITLNIQGVGEYQVELNDGDTGWDIMLKAQNEYQFTMKYQQYDFGVYITQLGEIATQDTYYWALYYNGQSSWVGISDLVPQADDTISWKYKSWM